MGKHSKKGPDECHCPFCDAEIEEGTVFCVTCEVEIVTCSNCGEPVRAGVESCPHCGEAST